jgi:hypothetical protein
LGTPLHPPKITAYPIFPFCWLTGTDLRTRLTAGRLRFAQSFRKTKSTLATLKQGPVGRNPIHGNS